MQRPPQRDALFVTCGLTIGTRTHFRAAQQYIKCAIAGWPMSGRMRMGHLAPTITHFGVGGRERGSHSNLTHLRASRLRRRCRCRSDRHNVHDENHHGTRLCIGKIILLAVARKNDRADISRAHEHKREVDDAHDVKRSWRAINRTCVCVCARARSFAHVGSPAQLCMLRWRPYSVCVCACVSPLSSGSKYGWDWGINMITSSGGACCAAGSTDQMGFHQSHIKSARARAIGILATTHSLNNSVFIWFWGENARARLWNCDSSRRRRGVKHKS